jgi:Tol biopolymer transport system component
MDGVLGKRGLVATIAVAALCLLAALPRPATASFPGRPGVIVFNMLSFESGPADPVGGLHAIRPDGSELRQLTENPMDYEPSFAPSGQRLVFRRFGTENHDGLYELNMRTGTTRRLVLTVNGDQDAAYGRRGMVAFTRFTESSYDLFIRTRDGDVRRLTNTSVAREHDPVFTPNGKRIVFARNYSRPVLLEASTSASRHERIYSIRTDGTGLRLLGTPREARDLDTAPNGRALVFGGSWSTNGRAGIWSQRLPGGDRRLIAENESHPAFSPGGGKVAYANYNGVWVRRINGREGPRQVFDAEYKPIEGEGKLIVGTAWQPLPR